MTLRKYLRLFTKSSYFKTQISPTKAQRRKVFSIALLCAFAPLRETFFLLYLMKANKKTPHP